MDKYQILINAKIKEILTAVGIDDDYSSMFVPQDLTEYEIRKSLVDIQPIDYELVSYFQNNESDEPADGLCDLWGPNVSQVSNFVFKVTKTTNDDTISRVDSYINPYNSNFFVTRDWATNAETGGSILLFKSANTGSFMKTGIIEKDIVVEFYDGNTSISLNSDFTIKGNRGGLILPDGTLYVPVAGDLVALDVLETAFNDYDDSLAAVAKTGDYSDLSNTPTLATVATTGLYSDLSGTPTLAAVATSGDYNDLLNKPDIAGMIASAITGMYKPAGSTTFANLPTPAQNVLGFVYNMTADFTTDSRFIEGSGKTYPVGTNVVVVATPAVYTLTEDQTAQSGKTYYSDATGTLVDPQPAVGDDISSAGYYELTEAAGFKFDVFAGFPQTIGQLP